MFFSAVHIHSTASYQSMTYYYQTALHFCDTHLPSTEIIERADGQGHRTDYWFAYITIIMDINNDPDSNNRDSDGNNNNNNNRYC